MKDTLTLESIEMETESDMDSHMDLDSQYSDVFATDRLIPFAKQPIFDESITNMVEFVTELVQSGTAVQVKTTFSFLK